MTKIYKIIIILIIILLLNLFSYSCSSHQSESEDINENQISNSDNASNNTTEVDETVILLPEEFSENNKYSLMFAVYWYGSNASDFSYYYKNVVLKKDFILTIPESSQKLNSLQHKWDNNELAKKEIKEAYEQVTENFNINNIIASGSSQGSAILIDMVLSNDIPCNSFILAAPYMPLESNKYVQRTLSDIIPLMKDAAKRNLKGVIVIGDTDPSYDNIIQMHEAMIEAGIICKLIVVPGANHGQTMTRFAQQYLEEALDFLNETSY